MFRKLYPLVTVGLIGVATGCASGTLTRFFSRSEALPQEVPKEMQAKFEVRDSSEQDGVPMSGPGGKSQRKEHLAPARREISDTGSARGRHASRGGQDRRRRASRPPSSDFVGPLPFSFPDRRPASDPIWRSEKLVYDISYFGVQAGEFTLEALPFKYVNGRRVYHIRGTARTSKVFSIFYMLNDMAESYIDYHGLFSHRFHISLEETKQSRDSVELYDSRRRQTFYWNRWERPGQPKIETKVFKSIDPFPQDTLSSLYYLRSVPLPEGAVIEFPVVSEGNTVQARVAVVRRETLDTVLGKVRCVVLKPEAKTRGVLTRKGDSYMWLTDDDRRFLVRLEAKVKIGTVVANLKEVDPGLPPTRQTPAPASAGAAPPSD